MDHSTLTKKELPSWFRQEIPQKEKLDEMRILLRSSGLHTVCEEAHCPNMGSCWEKSVATFMILGDVCCRGCRFCAVEQGYPKRVDDQEPRNVALAIKKLNLRYVVITSVTRDDIDDKGAMQFANVIDEIRTLSPLTKIEVLVPDFLGDLDALRMVVDAKPDVIGHNIETVKRIFGPMRPNGSYSRSLNILRAVKAMDSFILTKSSFMVGLGEKFGEIFDVMQDLRKVNCDLLSIGQYLAPSRGERHCPVEDYIHPEEFEKYKKVGLAMGFRHVMSSPLTRSSFMAEEGYNSCLK